MCNFAKPSHTQIRCPSRNSLASKVYNVMAMGFTLLETHSKGFENVLKITIVFSKFAIDVSTRDQKSSTVPNALVEKLVFNFIVHVWCLRNLTSLFIKYMYYVLKAT